MGIDQPEATALAFVDCRTGKANLQSLDTVYFGQQGADAFPFLDGVKNWLKIVKKQPIAFAKALEILLELSRCAK